MTWQETVDQLSMYPYLYRQNDTVPETMFDYAAFLTCDETSLCETVLYFCPLSEMNVLTEGKGIGYVIAWADVPLSNCFLNERHHL